MRRLSAEIQGILQEARDGHSEEPQEDDGVDWDAFDWDNLGSSPCLGEDSGPDCWKLQEAAQFVAEDVAEVTGLDSEVLSMALVEAMSCKKECVNPDTDKPFRTKKGDFVGGKGEAFKTCEKYAETCCTGVKDPAAFCAYLGRRAGKI